MINKSSELNFAHEMQKFYEKEVHLREDISKARDLGLQICSCYTYESLTQLAVENKINTLKEIKKIQSLQILYVQIAVKNMSRIFSLKRKYSTTEFVVKLLLEFIGRYGTWLEPNTNPKFLETINDEITNFETRSEKIKLSKARDLILKNFGFNNYFAMTKYDSRYEPQKVSRAYNISLKQVAHLIDSVGYQTLLFTQGNYGEGTIAALQDFINKYTKTPTLIE